MDPEGTIGRVHNAYRNYGFFFGIMAAILKFARNCHLEFYWKWKMSIILKTIKEREIDFNQFLDPEGTIERVHNAYRNYVFWGELWLPS